MVTDVDEECSDELQSIELFLHGRKSLFGSDGGPAVKRVGPGTA
jgi:hypothetical protein